MIRYKKKALVLSIVVLPALILAFVILNTIFNTNRNMGGGIVVNKTNRTYSDKGVLYIRNEILRFVDANSKEDIVLCDRPNCLHGRPSAANPVSACNAVLPGIRHSSYAILNDKLYFVSTKEGEPFNKKFLFISDINGSNRRSSAQFYPVEGVSETLYSGNQLIFSYINNHEKDDPSTYMEEPEAGVVLFDLKNNDTLYLPIKKNYASSLSSLHYWDDKIFYEHFYTDIDLYNSKNNIDYSSDEFDQLYKKHAFVGLYSYDFKTNTETCVYNSQNNSILAYDHDKAIIYNSSEGSVYEYDLLTFTHNKLFDDKLSSYIWVDNDRLIYSIAYDDYSTYELKYYDRNLKKTVSIGKFSANDIPIVDAIVDKRIYVSYMSDEVYADGYILKEHFYKGSFDKIERLIIKDH